MALRRADRPRRVRGRFFFAFLTCSCVLLLGVPATAGAQDPPPPPPPPPVDTLRADTLRAPGDTVVVPADTLPPARFVPFPAPGPANPRIGVWVWDHEALLAETALSVADLIRRIPGVGVLRTGTFLQPEAARVYGGTSDRVEIVRDGFVLDPLQASAIDLSTIRLAPLAGVIVERRIDLLRITLITDEPTEREAYSRVEAALGQPAVNLFRGIVLAPRVLFGPLSAAVERLDTDGRRGVEPGDIFETWGKWGWTRPDYGVQGEIRRWTMERRPASPWPLREERSEWVIRGRAAPLPGLVAEAYTGRTRSERGAHGALADDETLQVSRSAGQSGVRAGYEQGALGGYAAVRLRSGDMLARTQADVGAHAALGTLLRVGGDLTSTTWASGPSRLSTRVHAEVTPLEPLRLFAEAASGGRAAPFYGDTVRMAPIGSERTAMRAGAEARFGRITAGGAALRVETDSIAAFGMPFDSAFAQFAGGTADGVEAWGSLPIPRTPLVLSGWVTQWLDGAPWMYEPERSWHVSLGMNLSPLPSGNLDIRGHIEASHRGGLFAPASMTDATDLGVAPASTGAAAALYIRIIDVHIFGRYENLGDRAIADLPGRPNPGARFFYGVKWAFWN
jgi:hypothetical protein